ncbi:type II secretion system protein [Sulfurimonas sp.]|uniref:type II secretion system protein n=1 Tax=Sulfurimonas sp. TaxID=2022749 RepID=UPI003D125461
MKRAGFTMIELIFVIVILGILSAVALPKFVGVSEQANVGKGKAFIGTLNRTTAAALWSDSIANGYSGGVVSVGGSSGTGVSQADMEAQIDFPDIGESTDKLTAFSLANCGAATTSDTIDGITVGNPDTTGNANVSTFTIGTTQYGIRCSDGDMTRAPRFWLIDVTNGNNLLAK